jgi:hypothetical protein
MIGTSRQNRSPKEPQMPSHRHSRLARVTAAGLMAAALTPAAAVARPAIDPPVAQHTPQRPAVVVASTDHGGFDWGSAGIGAAAGAGLVLVGAGSFALTYRGRVRLAR